MWFEKVIKGLTGPQVINDSKTPSGRVHVGSLRGVLIHDAIYRSLKNQGFEATYLFGIDDFDPLDGLPADAGPEIEQYMGMPLCNVPAPPGSTASDFANHYIAEFLDIFDELGVGAQIYKTRDLYRSGKFNLAIDAILSQATVVRKIYAQVSHAVKADHWYPFQVICERCGKIGSTEVNGYDGKEVSYACKADLVSWAQGCGYQGKVSPFDGKGKLPWKLEWVAKWHSLGITIEGAGKDHCTKGGSRQVAVHCLKAIFGEQGPVNVPYEFFLLGGAKMSSSKGIGTTARNIADFLPAEILRFLMIRTPPQRTVNFSTDFEYIVKLFNEHDKLFAANLARTATEKQSQMLRNIEVSPDSSAYHEVGFQLLCALLQLPHIDVAQEIAKRTGEQASSAIAGPMLNSLAKRIAAARFWLDRFAAEEDRVVLQQQLPESAAALSATQCAFLHTLGDMLPSTVCSEGQYQTFIFSAARLTPIAQKLAFCAMYCVLLDKDQGPKGGALLSYLDSAFVQQRFKQLPYDCTTFWLESAISLEQAKQWLAGKQKDAGSIISLNCRWQSDLQAGVSPGKMMSVLEVKVLLLDNKTHLLRVLVNTFAEDKPPLDKAHWQKQADNYASVLQCSLACSLDS